jgi:hypothetical protein
MGHRLVIEVPDDVYKCLAKAAEKNGKTPEELIVTWLMAANGQHVKDPLEAFIGAFRSTIPGWP